MRQIDGRLSDRADHHWPRALVVREVLGEAALETWWLERPGVERVNLGRHYGEATRALGALIRAEGPPGGG